MMKVFVCLIVMLSLHSTMAQTLPPLTLEQLTALVRQLLVNSAPTTMAPPTPNPALASTIAAINESLSIETALVAALNAQKTALEAQAVTAEAEASRLKALADNLDGMAKDNAENLSKQAEEKAKTLRDAAEQVEDIASEMSEFFEELRESTEELMMTLNTL